MRRIAFVNEKGGTGKTTLAVHVAAWLAKTRGLRVLLVDLDTQGHAGKTLGLDVRTLEPNVFHFLVDRGVDLAAVARPTAIPGLEVVPAYKQMAQLAVALGPGPESEERLAERLEETVHGHDVVVLDGPPSLGLSVSNMLVAASEVVVPVALTYLALDGCAEVARTVERVAEAHHRPQLRVSAVVPMMHRHTALGEAVREAPGGLLPRTGDAAAGRERRHRRGPEPRADGLGVRASEPGGGDDDRGRRGGLAAGRGARGHSLVRGQGLLPLQLVDPALELLEALGELGEVCPEGRQVPHHVLHDRLHPIVGAALQVLEGPLAGAEQVVLEVARGAVLAAKELVQPGLRLLADGGHPRADFLLQEPRSVHRPGGG